MTAIFVSHAEEDQRPAIELACGLEAAGMKAWYYERDDGTAISRNRVPAWSHQSTPISGSLQALAPKLRE
jgi:hypothetical protein